MLLAGTAQRCQIRRGPAARIALPVAVGWRIVVQVVLVVGFDVGDEEKEGVFLVAVDIADDRVGLRVHPVAGQFHQLLVVVVHYHIVSIRGKFQQIGGQPVVVAASML